MGLLGFGRAGDQLPLWDWGGWAAELAGSYFQLLLKELATILIASLTEPTKLLPAQPCTCR